MTRGVAIIAAALVLVGGASGAASHKVYLGVTGDLPRFQALTGQHSAAHQAFLGWNQGLTWGSPLPQILQMWGPLPIIHIGTIAKPPSRAEGITPAAIAAGRGDPYFFAMNEAINGFGKLVYVRPLAEMNNPINLYSYERKRDAAHSPAAYQSAFCRIFYLLHGGTKAQVSAKLRAQGLPPVARDLPVNPYPSRLRVIWNPLAGIEHGPNPASRYFPGNGCTDMIGNDMFSSSVGGGSFEENQALYDAHPGKPYSLPEWGLEGVDDPSFIQRICDFVKTHRRTQLASYYESKPGSNYDIAPRPQSRAVYRRCFTPIGLPPPA